MANTKRKTLHHESVTGNTSAFPGEPHPRDYALREFMRRLELSYTRQYHPRQLAREYFDLAIRSREPLLLKLKFFAYVLTPPNPVFDRFDRSTNQIDDVIERLQKQYAKTFAAWWKDYIFDLSTKFPEPNERLEEFKRLHTEYPKEMHFHEILRKDYDVAMGAQIQETALHIAGMPTQISSLHVRSTKTIHGMKPTGVGTAGGKGLTPIPKSGPIVWTGKINVLVFLFDLLHETRNISDESHKHAIDNMLAFFVREDGKPFSRASLEQSKRNNKAFHGPRGPRGSGKMARGIRATAEGVDPKLLEPSDED